MAEKIIEILNNELKIETKIEDHLIFVDNRETIRSCHITMKKYSMHYLKQKKSKNHSLHCSMQPKKS